MATSPLTQSISNLTHTIKQEAGSATAKEFQVSAEAYNSYHNALHTFIAGVSQQLENATSLADYGPVGAWHSAQTTKKNLVENLNHPTDGFQAVLQNFHQFLNDHADAVTAAYKKFQAEDKSG